MKKHRLVTLALLMTASVTTAQHQHAAPNVIHVDGRDHPEQIPDAIAYGNFLILRSVSANASDEERLHQNGQLHMLQLDAGDNCNFGASLATSGASMTLYWPATKRRPKKVWLVHTSSGQRLRSSWPKQERTSTNRSVRSGNINLKRACCTCVETPNSRQGWNSETSPLPTPCRRTRRMSRLAISACDVHSSAL
jgi:hypothetical protein